MSKSPVASKVFNLEAFYQICLSYTELLSCVKLKFFQFSAAILNFSRVDKCYIKNHQIWSNFEKILDNKSVQRTKDFHPILTKFTVG